jgi:hypothetical protein
MNPLLLVLIAGGAAAAYFLTKKSTPVADTTGQPAQPDQPVTPPGPAVKPKPVAVLPQALDAGQRSALYKSLPTMDLVDGPTKTPSNASGTIAVSKISLKKNAISSEVRTDAFPIIASANLGGPDGKAHKTTILATMTNEPGGMEIAAVDGADLARSMLLPGSRWFLFMEPGQATTLSKEAGAPAIPANLPPIVMPDTGAPKQALTNPLTSSSHISKDNIVFKPIFLIHGLIGDKANTPLADIPGPTGINARAAATRSDSASMVTWADQLISEGYTKAAQALFDQAYAIGWRASPTDHKERMILGDMLDASAPNYDAAYIADGVVFSNAGDGSFNLDDLRALVYAAKTVPLPTQVGPLNDAAASFLAAGYTGLAGELSNLAKSIVG